MTGQENIQTGITDLGIGQQGILGGQQALGAGQGAIQGVIGAPGEGQPHYFILPVKPVLWAVNRL
jgi:hypothetical protein